MVNVRLNLFSQTEHPHVKAPAQEGEITVIPVSSLETPPNQHPLSEDNLYHDFLHLDSFCRFLCFTEMESHSMYASVSGLFH